jgi:ubiquinone/menaquinone biosynthesis C-methylase UbiE
MDAHAHAHTHAHGHGHGGDATSSWFAPELVGYLAALPEPPRTALDLGCGTGGDAVLLASRGIDVTGIDASASALDQARRRADEAGVQVTWIEGDVLELPLPGASVDLATDRGCLHHVAVDDQATYAREVARVLRPGGRLLLRDFNQPGHHAHAISAESVRAMVAGTPLEVVSFDHIDVFGPRGAQLLTFVVLELGPATDA